MADSSEDSPSERQLSKPSPDPATGSTTLPLLLLGTGALLRVIALARQEASVDEVSELAIASYPTVSEVIVAGDGFPPLFNLILRLVSFGGESVLVGRTLSAVAGALALLPLYFLARRLAGTRVARLTLLLGATSPFLIWYSQESRAYAFYFLFVCLSLSAFYRALETDDRLAWAVFVVSSFLGCLTHYYFAIVPALAGLIWLVRGLQQRLRHPRKRALVSLLAWATFLTLPLLLLRADLAHQSQYSDSFSVGFDPVSFGYTFFTFLHGMAIGPSVRRLHSLSPREALIEFAPWIAISALALGLILMGLLRGKRPPSSTDRPETLTRGTLFEFVLLILAPVLAAGTASLMFDVHYKPSYSIGVLAPLLVLLGDGLARLSLPLRALSLALLLSVATLSLVQRNLVPAHQTEELGSLSTFMESHADPDDTNLVMSAYVGGHLRQSFRRNWKIWLVPNAGCDQEGLERALAEAELQISQAKTPDQRLIYSRPFHGDPCGNFIQAMAKRYDLELEALFIGAEVYALRGDNTAGNQQPTQ